MKRITSLCIVPIFLAAQALATPLFTESFDFGSSTGLWRDNVAAEAVYGTTSIRHTYDATGLSHPQMLGEIGGMYTYQFAGGANSLDPNTSTGAFDPGFTGIAEAGSTYWLAALVRWGGGTSSLSLRLNATSGVNTLGFDVNGDGTISVAGSNNGGNATTLATGAQATAGETHLLLLRGTVGDTADANGPVNSVLDFWFDPADVFNLPVTPDYTTGSDSKFGRQGASYASVSVGGGSGSLDNVPALDEVRFGSDLAELFVVPEPSTFLMTALGLLALRGLRRT